MIFVPGTVGAQGQEYDVIKVKVEVVGDNDIDVQTDKYVRDSLAVFPDISLVEYDPDVYIHILVRELVTNRGRSLGYVMSSATSEIFDIVLESGHPYTFGDYNGLWLEMGPDLRTLCQQCVLAANSGVLDRIREDIASLKLKI